MQLTFAVALRKRLYHAIGPTASHLKRTARIVPGTPYLSSNRDGELRICITKVLAPEPRLGEFYSPSPEVLYR